MPSFFKHDMKSRVDERLEKDAEAARIWRAVCKAVDARDGKACRCCDKRSDPEATGLLRGHRHHIVYRSAGGQDTTANLVTLCAKCHNDEHQHRLLITGAQADTPPNADAALTFWRVGDDGYPYVVREEIAPRVIRKD